jgi:hypothetical protein
MSAIVLTNAYVQLQDTGSGTTWDISDFVTGITLSTSHELIETTQMNDVYRRMIAGLGQNQVTFEFNQDFESVVNASVGGLESVIYPFIGTTLRCRVRPVNAAVSAINPQYRFDMVISEWTPLSASVGELSTAVVTWPITGEITKTTT